MSGRSNLRRLFPLVPAVALVVGIELAVALSRATTCPGFAPTFSIPNAEFGWTHPSGATVRAYACANRDYEWSNVVEFNSHGLNSPEYSYEKGADTRRVLVLGDSVTEALQVPREQNFTSRLESMLRAPGRPVEVVNAGHSGFGTDNSLLFFESEGSRYEPDVVVLAFNLQNDIAENGPTTFRYMYAGAAILPKAGLSLGDDGKLAIDPAPYSAFVRDWQRDWWRSKRPLAWLREHSFFARRIANAWVKRSESTLPGLPPDYPKELDVYSVPPGEEWREAMRVTKALLLRLRDAVRKQDARLLVVIVPSRETVDPSKWKNLVDWFPALAEKHTDLEYPRQTLLSFLRENEFEFVDTTEHLRDEEARTGESAYFAFDPHPRSTGHAWIAEAVAPAVGEALEVEGGARRVE